MTSEFTRLIGDGLFTNIPLQPKQLIVKFSGEIIPRHPDYDDRVAAGRGGYGILIATNLVLDCYDNAQSRTCLASLANDPRHCFDTVNSRSAIANCRIAIRNREVSLRCGDNCVPVGTELSYAYGSTANRILD